MRVTALRAWQMNWLVCVQESEGRARSGTKCVVWIWPKIHELLWGTAPALLFGSVPWAILPCSKSWGRWFTWVCWSLLARYQMQLWVRRGFQLWCHSLSSKFLQCRVLMWLLPLFLNRQLGRSVLPWALCELSFNIRTSYSNYQFVLYTEQQTVASVHVLCASNTFPGTHSHRKKIQLAQNPVYSCRVLQTWL